MPVSAVRGVEVLGDAHRAAGIRAGIKVGTRIPGPEAVLAGLSLPAG